MQRIFRGTMAGAAALVLASCDVTAPECLGFGGGRIFGQVLKAEIGVGLTPAVGLQVRGDPVTPHVCARTVAGATDDAGAFLLPNLWPGVQWRLAVDPPQGLEIATGDPDPLVVRVTAARTDSVLIRLHFAPQDTTLTLYVAPRFIDCIVGPGVPATCLQVRLDPNQPFQPWSDPVQGFAYEEGFEHVLRVLRRHRPLVFADDRTHTFHLQQVVSKVPAPGSAP